MFLSFWLNAAWKHNVSFAECISKMYFYYPFVKSACECFKNEFFYLTAGQETTS